ncbi:helicase associated domain-containing protein [Streptomyces collinus]|uniref:helicase associated domain-containing protein n=1 Tax=Streptomyces collinus TaxID=42684 RepID=UPI003B219F44
MDWQRHHRVLADLAADEPGSRLPDIAPGVLLNGDDLGRWLKQQRKPATWKQLTTEQQQRLTRLGVTPSPAPAADGAAKGPGEGREQGTGGVPEGTGSPGAVGRTRRPAARTPQRHRGDRG